MEDYQITKECVLCQFSIEEENSKGFWNYCPRCGLHLTFKKGETTKSNLRSLEEKK